MDDEWITPDWRRGNNDFSSIKSMKGTEIFFDTKSPVSYMSSYFLSRWQQQNEFSEVLCNNKTILTAVKIGGRTYPTYFRVTEDFSPMTIGQDFFLAHKWKIGENNTIDTPYGPINIRESELDTELAEKVFTAEEVIKKKGRELKK